MLHQTQRGAKAMPASAGIAIVATATHRANTHDSQDAAAVVIETNFNAVIVADGMGALAGSGQAAHYCVRSMETFLHQEGGMSEPSCLFQTIQRGLAGAAPGWIERMDEEMRARIDISRSFGSTLLVGMETPDALTTAYVGNGCAIHIRGDFANFSEETALPWSFVNVLNPHTVMETGREALYRYLSPGGSPEMAEPSIVRIGKDRTFGDLLLIATDGLYSYDQVRRGRDPEGEVWISGEKTMVALHTALRRLFRLGELAPNIVQEALDSCLGDMKDRHLLEDDTTLGLIVTPEALAYRRTFQDLNASTGKEE